MSSTLHGGPGNGERPSQQHPAAGSTRAPQLEHCREYSSVSTVISSPQSVQEMDPIVRSFQCGGIILPVRGRPFAVDGRQPTSGPRRPLVHPPAAGVDCRGRAACGGGHTTFPLKLSLSSIERVENASGRTNGGCAGHTSFPVNIRVTRLESRGRYTPRFRCIAGIGADLTSWLYLVRGLRLRHRRRFDVGLQHVSDHLGILEKFVFRVSSLGAPAAVPCLLDHVEERVFL